MSTVHSTPPAAAPAGQRSHPVGFNDQTYYDPFFPSAPIEEHLIPIESDHSPSIHSHQTPSPPRTSLHHTASPAQDYYQLHPSSQPALINGCHSSHSPHADIDNEAASSAYDFLSPNVYTSDAGYLASSEHTATPEFGGNSFYLEDDYGMLVDPNPVELKDSSPLFDSKLQQPHDTVAIDSPQHSTYTRTSAGAATLSSHLMSPVLTDSGGSPSRHDTNSPPGGHHIKSERQPGPSVAPSMHDVNHGNMEHTFRPSQITPSVTESSKGTSPDLACVVPDINRAASPIIRVDGYSRGDSPVRRPADIGWNGSKRNRGGSNASHLTVQQNEDVEEANELDNSFGGDDFAVDQINNRPGLDPKARSQVSTEEVPNFKDQELKTQVVLKNIDVEEWLDRSDHVSENNADAPPSRPTAINKRQRAKSAGAQTLSHANLENFESQGTMNMDSHLPGPGVLINEDSGDDDDLDEEDVASIEDSPPPTTALGEGINDKPGNAEPGVYDELPNQPALYRAKLWQDPLYDSSDPGVKMQPETANAAIMRFKQRAGDIETLSRVATWGTRRMSESDLSSIFHRFSFTDKPQEPAKEKRDGRGSFLQQLSGRLGSKKSSGNLRRQDSDKSIKSKDKSARPTLLEHNRKDSHGSRKESLGVPQAPSSGLKRMSSLGKRPKSPRINTGSAVAAMAFQAGALGAGGSVSATGTSSPTAWPKNIMKRSRSRSELNSLKSQGAASMSATELGQPGLAEMWTKQGGPPMPTLAAPLKNEETLNSVCEVDDDDEDDAGEEQGVTMDLSIRPDSIVPTLEGFKSNIRELNPRLPSFMFDRIAQEQLRRFKKLMDFKIKHAQALNSGKCPSGKHCTELGGEPTYLPSKSSSREPELTNSGFAMAGLAHSDEDANALAEGIVTPAQFPPGVPMPPVKRLPAEFECSLCFKVKKFHKPSDWSKHVHEDVQPFTCTFASCAEPKSFKRKADWVRHENERHRQLEWWMCNMNECSHKCYRKDNFVQHLVREHKLPEPKIKTTKTGKPAVRGPSSQKARNRHGDDAEESNEEIDQVWKLVEECRHETPKNPKDEACKFCGNICNSWKKLTVHLAKHMEQISMPVLGVVKQKEVTPDTIISPIEQRIISQQNSMSPPGESPFSHSVPYGMPAGSVGELPGAFRSIQPQSNFFGTMTADQQPMNYQRVSPNTYPPPSHVQQLGANYPQNAGASPYVSDYSSYAESPPRQFNPVNNHRSYPHPQTSSPENMFNNDVRAPTSLPRASPYDEGNGFQYVPQQQQSYASPLEGSVYQFGHTTPTSYSQQTTPPTSYPMQTQAENSTPSSYNQPQASLHRQVPMQYGPMGQVQNYSQASADASIYIPPSQQRQHYPYGS